MGGEVLKGGDVAKLIKTASQHRTALSEVRALIRAHPAPGTEDAERLELLALLISKYEKERFPVGKPTPLEAIEFRMEQRGLAKRDLVPYLGSASRVSEVLSGKRALTLRMIRALHEGLGIPADVLLQTDILREAGADLQRERFPARSTRND